MSLLRQETVIFPFLVTQVLDEPAYRVGLAQMSLMAPAILFMLLGGSMADRADARTILIRVHALAAMPPILRATLLDATRPLFKRYKAMFALRDLGTEEAVAALCDAFVDGSALFRHPRYRRRANAHGAAGYHGDLSFQPVHHQSPYGHK